MNNYKKAREFYEYILNHNGYGDMTMIHTIDCVEESLKAYDMDLALNDEEKEKLCNLVLNTWLGIELEVGISKIADVAVENWNELKNKRNADILLEDMVGDTIGF